jgi:cell division protein FtsL
MITNEQELTAKSGKRGIMGIVLLFVLAGSLVGMVPVYMQNRIESLYRTFDGLREKASLMNREILLREFEINKLTSMEYLSKFAERAGLELGDVPVKVRAMGVPNE